MTTKELQILDSLTPPYDENLSETSTNAVQNKAVADAISDLNTRIDETVDETVKSITVDSIGAAKSDHDHDSRYYTESEIDAKVAALNSTISGKANSSHTHDDRYYTESEIDIKVNAINEELDNSIKSLSTSGKTITYTKNDGSTGTITTQDTNTDTKVTNTLATTTKAYVTGTTSASTNTGTQVFDTGVYLDTTAGQLTATTFKGNLSGKATSATSADSATKATQDGNGKVISSTYETKTDASSKLTEAKTYTDTVASGKSDSTHDHDEDYDTLGAANTALASAKSYTDSKTSSLASTTVVDNKISSHNTSTSAHSDIRALITSLTTKLNNFLDVDDTTTDQLSEVLTLINNNKGTLESLTTAKVNVSDIVNNLTTNSSSKVLSAAQGVAIKGLIDDLQTELNSHTHAITDVTGLQTALDGKAATSHGTHVSYSTTAPVMDGTASVGSASTVARSDHRHPTDTTRAAKTDLDSHTSNTTAHITSTERTNWNAAKTHADSAHAPSNAQANQNAFSYVKVGDTSVAADSTTDTLTLAGSNVTITPDTTNDKITFTVANGSTSAKGVVQLTNSTSSTSTTTAATPSSVKSAYDLATTAKTAADAAQSTADSKANASHAHAITDVTNLQASLDAKQATITGGATTITSSNLTTNRALVSNASGKVAASDITSTELNYLDGVTSNIQTQLNARTSTSVIPNNSGEIKTKYRIAQKGYTSGNIWYYKICDFPTNNNGNYASAIISGRIGGWTSDNMSYVNALIWNRGTPGIALIDIAGSASATSSIWGIADLVLYTNGTSATAANTATLYVMCKNYFTFDLDLELFQSGATITYDGSYVTTTPSGTLAAQSSTTTKRVEVINEKMYVNGSQLAFSSHTHDDRYYTESEIDSKVTSLQTSIDGKAASSHTHKVANITDLTATATELNYMDGVTSNVQTQLDGKSSTSHTHNLSTMINTLSTGTSTPTDADYYVCQYAGGGTTTTTYHRRPLSALWNWIKSKADSVYQAKGSYASSSHTHDDRYYTETEIDTKVSTINTAISGKAASSHTHTIANVTNLQSSLDAKQATVTGGASTITSSNLTASRALISNSSGKVAVSDVTSTELGYLDGVTSNVQTQLDSLKTSVNGKMSSSIVSLEMNSAGSLKNYGGFIDFHYHNSNGKPTNASGTEVTSTPDYTSRIIEDSAGTISVNGVKMKSGTITGSLSGNATTATKATQDGSGNTITSTYATKTEVNAKAPAYTYSTTDLTAGSSSLATGKLYIVYE